MQTEGSAPSRQSAGRSIDSFDSGYPQERRIPANITQFTFDLIGSHEELRVVNFNGTEAISAPFEYNITLASKNDLLEADQFMSKSALLTFMAHEQNELLHGEIAQFEQYDEQGDFLLYRVVLVPRFWFLQKRHNHRIFQNLSVVQIIEQIFSQAGFSSDHYALQLSQEYLPRSYCTQYDESEFDFLSRLMAEEGLHYHFEHQLDRHIMVIADHTAAFADVQGDPRLPYHPRDGLNQKSANIFEFRFLFQTRYGKASSRDYCFKKSLNTLQHQQQHSFDTHLEDYTYPGNYQDQSGAQKSTQLQLQQHQHKREQGFVKSNCQRLRAGRRYQLYDNPNRQLNQQYLLTRVIHQGEQAQSLDEYGAGASGQYHNECQCIPARIPYKTPLRQQKPLIAGYQSAAVTGPDGEEIYTNEHAQSKVQYPWDREGQQDENSSCWLRSTQGWAGKNWGSLILPRMGQEAKVAYIHGDPDRPIITGRLYNERHKLPYALPSHKTRSSYKSNSTLGGKGYNEIRMEDKKSHEQIFFHAQKDIDIRAKNDRRDIIQHDRHLIVDNNRYEHIKSNSYHTTNANQNEKVGQQHSISIGQTQHLKAGQAILTDAGQNIYFKAGQKIVLEAGVELTIKAGGGFIKIDPSGITAQGAAINLNSGSGAGTALKASPQSPSAAVPADQDKSGQNFTPTPPQAKQEAEKIGFKGEISRLLQAGNDTEQAVCIPCLLAQQTKQPKLTRMLPNSINTCPRSSLAPLPLESLPTQELIDIPISLTYSDQEATPVISVAYRMIFNNGEIRTGELDEKGQAVERGVPTGGGEIEFAYEDAPDIVNKEIEQLYSDLDSEVTRVAEQTRDAYIAHLDNETVAEEMLTPKARQLREDLRSVIKKQVDELTAESEKYNSSSWISRRWEDTKSAGIGVGHGVTDYIPDLGEFGELMDVMGVDMLDMADALFNGDLNSLKDIEDKLKSCDRCAGGFEEAKESMETLILLLSDKTTREIIISLPQKFLAVTANNKLVEIGMSQATQSGIDAAAVGGTTFVAGVLTAGPGSVAGAAISLTATSARKAGKILEAMMAILKKIAAGLKKLRNRGKKHDIGGNTTGLKTRLLNDTNKEYGTKAISKNELKNDTIKTKSLPKRKVIELEPGQKGNWNKTLNGPLEPGTDYKVGNKTYETDEYGRVGRVSGELASLKRDRNTYQQVKAGKTQGIKDGHNTDEGGHVISSRHDGAGEQINYVPMNSNLNKGAWKRMENVWDNALKEGKKVEVDIKPIYEVTSKRPDGFGVKYWVDGKKKTVFFENKPTG